MKIGIDISQVVYKGSGVSRFTAGLIDAICKYDTDNEWHFFYSHLRQPLGAAIEKKIYARDFSLHKMPIPPSALSLLWNNIHIVDVSHITGKLDWFITSDWTEPPASCKKATVIHDFAYKRYPGTVAASIRRTQESRLGHVSKESDLIFTDSISTKSDAIKYLGLSNNKLVVNYPGVELSDEGDDIISTDILPKKYILTVGKREPRKNLQRLIDAYKTISPHNISLVIVGDKGWGYTPDPNEISSGVHFLGFVSDKKLKKLYTDTICFVFPSIWEGFGYPIIEAMSCGAPVATSNNSSLGEVAKGNAVLFDPFDTKDIASALQRLLSDEKLRKELSKKGREHSRQFTWKRYFETMISMLEKY